MREYVAVHSNAAAAAVGKAKGKAAKKKGVTLALDVFNETLQTKPAAEQQEPRERKRGHRKEQPQPPAAAEQPAPPPPQQRAPRMGEFPSLDAAQHGDLDGMPVFEAEPDYLHEALNQLKQGRFFCKGGGWKVNWVSPGLGGVYVYSRHVSNKQGWHSHCNGVLWWPLKC